MPGARWLHVVDLDGARSGTPAHAQVIRSIVDAVGQRVAVEVAGGLRTSTAVAEAIAAGAARAVVGTAALRDPDFAGDLVRRHGADRIAVAIDVRDGLAVGEGWRSDAPGPAVASIVAALADVGITTFEVTAIDRDGLLGGPDLGLLSGLIDPSSGDVIASGGVASLDDIRAVAATRLRRGHRRTRPVRGSTRSRRRDRSRPGDRHARPRLTSRSGSVPAVAARRLDRLAVLLDDLVGHVAGDVFVVVEPSGERATPVGE